MKNEVKSELDELVLKLKRIIRDETAQMHADLEIREAHDLRIEIREYIASKLI
ncbi:hypothetical protein [Sporosarcina sp. ITBMC105]